MKLKFTKFDFGWGSAPDPAGGAYSAPSDPLAGIEGPTSKGRGEKEWKEAWEGKRERGGCDPPNENLAYAIVIRCSANAFSGLYIVPICSSLRWP